MLQSTCEFRCKLTEKHWSCCKHQITVMDFPCCLPGSPGQGSKFHTGSTGPKKKKRRLNPLLRNSKSYWSLTHFVPWTKALIPCVCAHTTCRTRASFRKRYCRCLGKHSQTETGFKTNFLLIKGQHSNTSYCILLMFKSAEMRRLFKDILVFYSTGYRLFIDIDSQHKVDDSDNGWVLDS